MTDYRTRLVEVVHGKPLSRVYCLSDATLIADLGQLLSEAERLSDQLDKAKAENDAQAVELERMREALGAIVELGDFSRRHPAQDDFDRGARAARLDAADLARQALQAG